ncbi:MAG: hypothetical protein INR69_16055 [Mucilaginibacter polytrichastri]|nr:hypothetical protein [Mucilaginibacter polytrichastri]
MTKKHEQEEEKDWTNPADPKQAADERDQEQLIRQKKEAERRHDNLTEKEHIDKPNNN